MNSRVKLSEVCVATSSNLLQKNINKEKGAYPVFGASGQSGYIEEYAQKEDYLAVVKDGAGIGRVFYLPQKSSVIGTLQYINTIRKDINLKYLFYVLQHLDLAKYKSGATIPHIYFKDYSNQTFYLPSMEDQKEIVRIFDIIEKTKEKMNEMLKDLDLMVKSREVRELYYNE